MKNELPCERETLSRTCKKRQSRLVAVAFTLVLVQLTRAHVAWIATTVPSTLSTRRRHMHYLPQRQKYDREEAHPAIMLAPRTRLPLPAPVLPALKGGPDLHPPGRPIREQKPGLLLTFVPERMPLHFAYMLLPEPQAWLADHLQADLPAVSVPRVRSFSGVVHKPESQLWTWYNGMSARDRKP